MLFYNQWSATSDPCHLPRCLVALEIVRDFQKSSNTNKDLPLPLLFHELWYIRLRLQRTLGCFSLLIHSYLWLGMGTINSLCCMEVPFDRLIDLENERQNQQ